MGVTKVKEEKKEEKKPKPVKVEKKEKLRELVRVANTDLDANKSLHIALTGVKGISHTLSRAICNVAGFDIKTKLSSLSEKDIEKIEEIINDPLKFGIPSYIVNRRKDIDTGKDLHLTGADLDIARKFDVKKMIDLKTWKGFRHMFGQPVRGQRTRSHFREKGRIVGVMRKAVRQQMQKAGAEEKEKK